MDNESWQEIVDSLVAAKRCLANAWQVLDGTDGTAPGVEQALNAALSSIDAMYAIEHRNRVQRRRGCAVEVQKFWDDHGSLPGFAVGT